MKYMRHTKANVGACRSMAPCKESYEADLARADGDPYALRVIEHRGKLTLVSPWLLADFFSIPAARTQKG